MGYATATFPDVSPFDVRFFTLGDLRRSCNGLIVGLGSLTGAVILAGAVVVAAVWIVCTALSHNPQFHARADGGPARLALATQLPGGAGSVDVFGSAGAWRTATFAPTAKRPPLPPIVASPAPIFLPAPPPRVAEQAAPLVVEQEMPIVRQVHVAAVPLPRARPAMPEIAKVPVEEPKPKVAELAPVPPPPAAKPPVGPDKVVSSPAIDGRTAIYDIAAHTVYMPDGERLEAHSGLGRHMDDPRSIKAKGRGPTPPNVYRLTLREQLFHGVRAIRLNPIDDDRMFGRDGMLAHTYMLGPSGQSNGCVSFKNYRHFLQAFLNGKVDRMVVVPRATTAMLHTIPQRKRPERYAYVSPID